MEFFTTLWTGIVATWRAVRLFFFTLFYESYVLQAILIVFLLCLPLLIRLCRRWRMVKKIKKVCKAHGYTFTAHRKSYLLGNFKHADCEFSIQTKTRAYAVKLITTPTKNHHLRLLDETNLELVRRDRLFGANSTRQQEMQRLSRMPRAVRWYPHSEWSFFTYADRDLPTESVLLCYPTPRGVSYKRPRSTLAANNDYELVALADGMMVWGMIYHTPEGFLKKLNSLKENYTLYSN